MKAKLSILVAILVLALASLACGRNDFEACTNTCALMYMADSQAYAQCYTACQIEWEQ